MKADNAEDALQALYPPAPKHKVRDSVFTLLFRIKKYMLMLCLALHIDEMTDSPLTEDSLTDITLSSVFVRRLYNDLGFLVGDRLIILVEAQSTWTVNIIIREMIYMMFEYYEYIMRNKLNIFSSKPVKLPKPLLYVLYTGPGEKPDELLLSKEFFNGEQCDIEVRVRVVRKGANPDDIISQYAAFCDVWGEQRNLYGQTAETIRETIRICKDMNVLKEFLEEHEPEVYSAMELFDDDFIIEAAREEGRMEGRLEGSRNTAEAFAVRLLRKGMSLNDIHEFVPELTISDIRAVAADSMIN